MKHPDCDICDGPDLYGHMEQLIESDLYRVELNPNQQHLGRAFVGLREHKSTISDLNDEEMVEWLRVARELEGQMKRAFGAVSINWLCLMNDALRDGKETHVHWHAVPRYNRPVTFNGHVYTDSAYPRQYNTGSDSSYFATKDEINAITRAMQKSNRE